MASIECELIYYISSVQLYEQKKTYNHAVHCMTSFIAFINEMITSNSNSNNNNDDEKKKKKKRRQNQLKNSTHTRHIHHKSTVSFQPTKIIGWALYAIQICLYTIQCIVLILFAIFPVVCLLLLLLCRRVTHISLVVCLHIIYLLFLVVVVIIVAVCLCVYARFFHSILLHSQCAILHTLSNCCVCMCICGKQFILSI